MSNNSNFSLQRFSLLIQGTVQGVGFRPYIYKLAQELGLKGWVSNSLEGVLIDVEGEKLHLDSFFQRLEKEKPINSEIIKIECQNLPLIGHSAFSIISSSNVGSKQVALLPDIATCQECLQEIFDSTNRRYNYPFTNCINCGPRFSIIKDLPYDRHNTSMKNFQMCEECQKEYDDPRNRRFHAQPNACPSCGPQLEFWSSAGKVLAIKGNALDLAIALIKKGKIVAVKNTGGFHLIVDAANKKTVSELRRRKHRDEKPFALLYPSLDLVKQHTHISKVEEEILSSVIAPIVLLKRHECINPFYSVAPDNPYLGIMLASNPLQYLMLSKLGIPLIATSGNISDEPICTDENEAVERLGTIADGFLVHNRPIVQPIDDSIVQVVLNHQMVLRRARGYACMLAELGNFKPEVLAVGGHLKNTVAMSTSGGVFFSQHIGNLDTEKSFDVFEKTINKIKDIYETKVSSIAYDLHPEYLSTKYATKMALQEASVSIGVQHHYAHILSCMAENKLNGDVLGVAWDGSGYGLDGTIWGGEFLETNETGFSRVAHLKGFPLLGGEKAIKEPRRVALGLFYEAFGEDVFQYDLPFVHSFTKQEINVLTQMLKKKINCPLTSSVGRLFDAMASVLNLQQYNSFEAQSAMKLEFAISNSKIEDAYEFDVVGECPSIIDWKHLLLETLSDLEKLTPISTIASKFHNALANLVTMIAQKRGKEKVVLTGGCFQNRYLLEKTILSLQNKGFSPYWNKKIPTNDGGISLGQLVAVTRTLQKG